MAWNRFRLPRTTEALRAATTYMLGELIQPKDGTNAFRPYIGDGTTAGGRPLAFRDEVIPTAAGAIYGAVPFNDATAPNTTLGVSPGYARDRSNAVDIVLATSMTKRLDQAWTAGTGLGGRMSAAAVAANTGYHIYLIRNPTTGVVDIGFDTSATNPTLPGGFTQRRRIGCLLTDGSGNIRAGRWYADGKFTLKSAFTDFSSVNTSPFNPLLQTLKVPMGVKLFARYNVTIINAVAGQVFLEVRDPDAGVPVAADASAGRIFKPSTAPMQTRVEEWTDANGNWYFVTSSSDANTALTGYLDGWMDLRERHE